MAKPFDYWLKKNHYYHNRLIKFFKFAIPEQSKILQINCKNGYLLGSLNPSVGVGIDYDQETLKAAKTRYPQYSFYQGDIDQIQTKETRACFWRIRG